MKQLDELSLVELWRMFPIKLVKHRSDTNTRCSFNKGYTPKGYGKRVFHLHLRRFNDNDELYFRDYLNEYPMLAREYEAIKLALCRQFRYDRDEYTKGKTLFVHEYTEKTIQKYGRIY